MGVFTGRLVHPFMLRPGEIDILDIAHSQSQACRFGGHTMTFYSNAQHACEVSYLVRHWGESTLTQILALFHDSDEAYFYDISAPVKIFFPAYRRAGWRARQAVYRYFTGSEPTPEQERVIKMADLVMTATEGRALMRGWEKWPKVAGIEPLPKWRGPISMKAAEKEFLDTYERLQVEWESERRQEMSSCAV